MNLISFTTFMLAAGINLQAAYGAEAKQHVRKLQSDETGEQVEKELAEDIEELAQNWWGKWPDPAPHPPVTCPLLNGASLESSETICLILPNGVVPGGVPGTPTEATNGIFCSGPGGATGYELSIDDVSQGSQKLLRANLVLPTFGQNEGVGGGTRKLEGEALPPIVVEALTGVPAQSGDIAMIQGGTAPKNIVFQGFWDENECSFRLVSTQGGELTGKFTGGTTFNIEFTQTGQVTSLLSTLGEDFDGAIGTITLDFAFAFKGDFD